MCKKFFLTLTIIFAILMFSCNESIKNNNNPKGPDFTPPGVYSWNDILQKYNQTNVLGYIMVERFDAKIYQGIDTTKLVDAVEIYANASFFDEDYNFISAGQFLFNANQFIEFETGKYSYDPTLDVMDIYFDGTWNKFKNESPSDFPLFVDSVQFNSIINITNIQRGAHISRSNNLTVQWTGTNDDVVGIFLDSHPFQGPTDSTDLAQTTGAVVDNTGSFTIPASKLAFFRRGIAYLTIISYQPRFVTVSGGSKICILGVSRQEITIHIDN
ncbi:hypothetical protein D9V86_08010 [Bacteroidetes/Chlorobi group bacterium ChocPot_Mid]|nr:MAG: hypothetical protein D9V86_08010 [Bacteroidetes/Chlorobi group bacterium ChocPot_Mid]